MPALATIPAAFSAAAEFGLDENPSAATEPNTPLSSIEGRASSWWRHPSIASAVVVFGFAGLIVYLHPHARASASAGAGSAEASGEAEGSI